MLKEIVCKDNLKKELMSSIKTINIERALSNSLSRRKPRPCGFTVHTGYGCSFKCIYCYISDMGFPWSISKTLLSGYEVVYALISNPYFIPGDEGSLIALGSVTEPFHPLTINTTIDYIDKIVNYLKNPLQFSTKMALHQNIVNELKNIDLGISPLVTIISIKNYELLEPYAPPPERRFETISILRKNGFKPFLFLRPVIPGLIENEYTILIDKSYEYGAKGIVIGSLRVTVNVLSKLVEKGIDISEIMKRLPRRPHGREQVSVDTRDLKNMIANYAKQYKLVVFPEACMANLYTHGYSCWKMIHLGCSTGFKPKYPSRGDVYEIACELDVGIEDIKLSTYRVDLWISNGWSRSTLLSEIIHSRYKICVGIHRV